MKPMTRFSGWLKGLPLRPIDGLIKWLVIGEQLTRWQWNRFVGRWIYTPLQIERDPPVKSIPPTTLTPVREEEDHVMGRLIPMQLISYDWTPSGLIPSEPTIQPEATTLPEDPRESVERPSVVDESKHDTVERSDAGISFSSGTSDYGNNTDTGRDNGTSVDFSPPSDTGGSSYGGGFGE